MAPLELPARFSLRQKMDKGATIPEIIESLRKLLSQLDKLRHPIAAIKVSETISALSKAD